MVSKPPGLTHRHKVRHRSAWEIRGEHYVIPISACNIKHSFSLFLSRSTFFLFADAPGFYSCWVSSSHICLRLHWADLAVQTPAANEEKSLKENFFKHTFRLLQKKIWLLPTVPPLQPATCREKQSKPAPVAWVLHWHWGLMAGSGHAEEEEVFKGGGFASNVYIIQLSHSVTEPKNM